MRPGSGADEGGMWGEGRERVRRGWLRAGSRVRVFNSVLQFGWVRGDGRGDMEVACCWLGAGWQLAREYDFLTLVCSGGLWIIWGVEIL